MPAIYSVSDRAIQIDWPLTGGKVPSVGDLSALAHSIKAHAQKLKWPVCTVVQADHCLSLLFQESLKGEFTVQHMVSALCSLLEKPQKMMAKSQWKVKHHTVAVNYGGAAGQDLDFLAEQAGLSTHEVIELHSSAVYTVQFLGFLPGFAYLQGLPTALQFPRRATPRARVPAGTLAIGAAYSAVYPWESPGGWHLLGHVERILFDPEPTGYSSHSLFQAGDTVQFIRAEHA